MTKEGGWITLYGYRVRKEGPCRVPIEPEGRKACPKPGRWGTLYGYRVLLPEEPGGETKRESLEGTTD
jgi:hypothetical protein